MVDRIILWMALTIGGIAVYLLIVIAAPPIVAALAPNLSEWDDGMWIVVPLSIAVAIAPLRGRLQRRIDLLVYGKGLDVAAVISRFSARIGELEPGAAGVRSLCAALRAELRLGSVAVRTPEVNVQSGRPRGHPFVIALRTADGDGLGDLIVSAPAAQRLDARTVRVLEMVSGVLAAAVQLTNENVVLAAARAEVMERRADERRRLQRELHDGLGPALAGIGFGLAAVGNLVETRPADADALLCELSDELAHHARAVRTLANEVSAWPLRETRLVDAVARLAERFSAPGLVVTVDLAVDDGVSAPVREAIYFVVAEALSNAARHAHATGIDVRAWQLGADVVVEIADDGAGMDASAPPGVGLASMRARANALGGSLRVTADETGTRVRALFPGQTALDDRDAPSPTMEAWHDQSGEP